ncbi:hypothetical protein [Chitinophaga deserti]|uniref:hypothetical protein n=1 Tax=Chitinophaga deserti TaxID=2164099 RepID=UPI0013001C98|nr:hypothetical protein [Chitinophaga deserti]
MDSLFFVTGALIYVYCMWSYILILSAELLYGDVYYAIAHRHPDSMQEFTGPYSGKKVRLYVHRENPPEWIEKAKEIQHEIHIQYHAYHLKRLQKH